jgi:hypothetical protein
MQIGSPCHLTILRESPNRKALCCGFAATKNVPLLGSPKRELRESASFHPQTAFPRLAPRASRTWGPAQRNVETWARGFFGTPAHCGSDRYPLSGLKTEIFSHHRPGRPIRYNLSDATGGCRRGATASAVNHAAGRSSAWLERLVWDQEVACSNHVAPTEESSLETRGFRRFWAERRAGGKNAGATPGQPRATEAFGPALQHARWDTTFAPLVAPVRHRRSEPSEPERAGQQSEV